MKMKALLATIFFSISLSAQVTDNGPGPYPTTGRVCWEDSDTGRTCWTPQVNTSAALDSYGKAGDFTQGERDPRSGQLTRGGIAVKFANKAQALLWQIVNRLAQTWLQSQAKAAITGAAQELATQQATPQTVPQQQ